MTRYIEIKLLNKQTASEHESTDWRVTEGEREREWEKNIDQKYKTKKNIEGTHTHTPTQVK